LSKWSLLLLAGGLAGITASSPTHDRGRRTFQAFVARDTDTRSLWSPTFWTAQSHAVNRRQASSSNINSTFNYLPLNLSLSLAGVVTTSLQTIPTDTTGVA
jgi:hypothetical protein